MAQPDWTRGDLGHRLTVLMIDPLNLTTERGELEGVVRGGSYDLAYYSDTRMGAKVSTFTPDGPDNWDGTAALRLVHTVFDYTGDLWSETLGTFYVTGRDWDVREGGYVTNYVLSGTMHGLETNVTPHAYTIAKGARALDVIKRVMTITSRPYYAEGGARNYTFSGPVVYDAGTSYLSILFDVCNRSNNRISVVRDGRIVISPYVAPSQKAATFETVAGDPHGMFIGPFSTGDAGLDLPERAIVSATKDNRTITGTAIAKSGTRMRHSRRGYGIDDFRSLSNMTPFTQRQADALAARYLASDDTEERTADHALRYRPLREGDIELLTVAGATKRWHVKNASLDLASWTWKLSLRGGWAS